MGISSKVDAESNVLTIFLLALLKPWINRRKIATNIQIWALDGISCPYMEIWAIGPISNSKVDEAVVAKRRGVPEKIQ